MQQWLDEVEELLIKELKPSKLILEDVTEQHLNHEGHSVGKAHLKLEIDSALFSNKSKVEQHKIVYSLLEPYLKHKIHSLSLKTDGCES